MKKQTMEPEALREYQARLTTPEAVVQLVKNGDCVYYGTNISTAIGIDNLLAQRERELEDVAVVGASCFQPNGLLDPNSRAFHPSTFYFGNFERGAQKGKYVNYTSVHLSETDHWVRNVVRPNVAFLPVSQPDENGYMSYGPAGLVCGPFLLETAELIVLVVNPNVPYLFSDDRIHVTQATHIVEMDDALAVVPNLEPSAELEQISRFVADETPDGACIQMGIGDLATAIGFGLREKNDLGVHTEMIGDSIMDLIKRGNVTNTRKRFMRGVSSGVFLMGTQELYDWADWNEGLRFMPPCVGNNICNIAQNDHVLSVNTALEIDLAGQVVADNIAGRQYSSVGGQMDYVMGAQLSKGGKSFIAMTATHTRGGKLYSNIVSRLKPETFVTTPRSCVQYVVTEYGCVNLKNMAMRERVLALIDLAHPQFREQLRDEAKEYGLIP